MRDAYKKLDQDQLLTACGVLESTILSIIQKLDAQGVDTQDIRAGLNRAHMAVDGLTE